MSYAKRFDRLQLHINCSSYDQQPYQGYKQATILQARAPSRKDDPGRGEPTARLNGSSAALGDLSEEILSPPRQKRTEI